MHALASLVSQKDKHTAILERVYYVIHVDVKWDGLVNGLLAV